MFYQIKNVSPNFEGGCDLVLVLMATWTIGGLEIRAGWAERQTETRTNVNSTSPFLNFVEAGDKNTLFIIWEISLTHF